MSAASPGSCSASCCWANATNLLILATGGYAGLAPIFDKDTAAGGYNDPLPQALILTSIVISFAVDGVHAGHHHRTWVLARQDEIQDDAEDRRVARRPASTPRTTP